MKEKFVRKSSWSILITGLFCGMCLIFNSCKDDKEPQQEVYSPYNAKGIQIYLNPNYLQGNSEVLEDDIFTQYFWINKEYIHWADDWDEDKKIESTVNINLPYYEFTLEMAHQIYFEIFGIDMDKIEGLNLTTYQISLWNYLMTHRSQYKYIAYDPSGRGCLYLFKRTSSVNYD